MSVSPPFESPKSFVVNTHVHVSMPSETSCGANSEPLSIAPPPLTRLGGELMVPICANAGVVTRKVNAMADLHECAEISMWNEVEQTESSAPTLSSHRAPPISAEVREIGRRSPRAHVDQTWANAFDRLKVEVVQKLAESRYQAWK